MVNCSIAKNKAFGYQFYRGSLPDVEKILMLLWGKVFYPMMLSLPFGE